jgi:hypothetical protein
LSAALVAALSVAGGVALAAPANASAPGHWVNVPAGSAGTYWADVSDSCGLPTGSLWLGMNASWAPNIYINSIQFLNYSPHSVFFYGGSEYQDAGGYFYEPNLPGPVAANHSTSQTVNRRITGRYSTVNIFADQGVLVDCGDIAVRFNEV